MLMVALHAPMARMGQVFAVPVYSALKASNAVNGMNPSSRMAKLGEHRADARVGNGRIDRAAVKQYTDAYEGES